MTGDFGELLLELPLALCKAPAPRSIFAVGASLGNQLEVCSLCKMLLLCPIGIIRLGISVSISPLLGKILSSC